MNKFKKRVRDKAFVCLEEATIQEEMDSSWNDKVDDTSLSINWEELMAIFEEARKEFPKEPYQVYQVFGDTAPPPSFWVAMHNFLGEYRRWKKKWLNVD